MQFVFIKDKDLKNEPYTTSKIISEYGGQEHESVVRLIGTYQKELREFGKLPSVKERVSRFEIGKVKDG